VGRALVDRLRVMPAVVVTGARQTGKSTLARQLVPGDRRYATLDDLDVLDAARRDPETLIGAPGAVTLDEVQREPALLRAVKRAIDRDRTSGRFLLTGSANLLLMRRVSESLAGRASYLTLWPMTRREQHGLGRCGRWDDLLATPEAEWRELLGDEAGSAEDWKALARRGGFPTPALALGDSDRAIWFDGYVRTYLERDLQDLASISALPDFRRLMRASALRLGQLVNQTDLGRDVALSQPTVHRWLNMLETSYLLVRLPAYAVNRTKRLVKAPKVYWGDTGVALHLSEGHEPGGPHLENLVLQDLLTWRDARVERAELGYWRTATGEEVDFVIETGGKLLPIEVKAAQRPRLADAAHLHAFRAEYGKKARAGLLLHSGDALEWLAAGVLAAPWWRVV
jgi:predicted AAA+ superfamily ATPase